MYIFYFIFFLLCRGSLRIFEGESYLFRKSVWTLADCKWRAAAPGSKPLRLPRARKRSQSPVDMLEHRDTYGQAQVCSKGHQGNSMDRPCHLRVQFFLKTDCGYLGKGRFNVEVTKGWAEHFFPTPMPKPPGGPGGPTHPPQHPPKIHYFQFLAPKIQIYAAKIQMCCATT